MSSHFRCLVVPVLEVTRENREIKPLAEGDVDSAGGVTNVVSPQSLCVVLIFFDGL